MKKNIIKSRISSLKPKLIKGISNTIQGYVFGCMMGLFTGTESPSFGSVHRSGKDVAKICAVYSATETVLETVRDKDDHYNGLISGAVTGALCSKGPFLEGSTFLGSASLGLYSALFGKSDKEI
ncbi:hypothetical protein P3W45_001009 [Vairimorpha bombi]|jgi:hypothetical protein